MERRKRWKREKRRTVIYKGKGGNRRLQVKREDAVDDRGEEEGEETREKMRLA